MKVDYGAAMYTQGKNQSDAEAVATMFAFGLMPPDGKMPLLVDNEYLSASARVEANKVYEQWKNAAKKGNADDYS